MTDKLDKSEKDKIREEIKKRDLDKATAGMGFIQRTIKTWLLRDAAKPHIPYKDRSVKEIICLKDINLKIKKGCFTVILGPTGSGKSSLLNAMLGDLMYLPRKTIDEMGDQERRLKDGELRYLEHALL